jgi:hypothetical protein
MKSICKRLWGAIGHEHCSVEEFLVAAPVTVKIRLLFPVIWRHVVYRSLSIFSVNLHETGWCHIRKTVISSGMFFSGSHWYRCTLPCFVTEFSSGLFIGLTELGCKAGSAYMDVSFNLMCLRYYRERHLFQVHHYWRVSVRKHKPRLYRNSATIYHRNHGLP